MDFFGYGIGDFIPCEICGKSANAIHHIKCKGMGGSKKRDNVENLMALCNEHHLEYGDKKQFLEYLQDIHKQKVKEYE